MGGSWEIQEEDKNMNRKETRKQKSFVRQHAAKIAKQCVAFCFDLDENGCYVQITNPIAVETLRRAFEQHLLGQDDVPRHHQQSRHCILLIF